MMENQSAHAIKASLERIKTEKEKAMKRKVLESFAVLIY